MTLSYLHIVGNLSFGLTALSFLMRDILLLRIFATVSSLLGVAYNYLIPEGPLWLVIFWLSVFASINLVRIIMLFLENRGIKFSEEEQELYDTVFKSFAPVEFMKLIRVAEWRMSAEGEYLAVEDEPLDSLKLIYNGDAVVEKHDLEIAQLHDGRFVGEVSYLQGTKNATATVRTVRTTRYLSWQKEELRKLLKRNPTMDMAMNTLFQHDIIDKLAHTGDDL
jgi:hypothetical protein